MSSVHQSHADVKKHCKKLYAIVGSGYVSKTLRHNLWVPWKHGGNDRRANGRFLTGHTFRIVRNLCHLLNSTRVINLRLNRFDCCESLVIPFFFLFTLCPLYSIENVDKRNFPVHVCWGYSLYPSSLAHDRPYNYAYFAFYLILLSNQRPFRIESSYRPTQLYSILHSL